MPVWSWILIFVSLLIVPVILMFRITLPLSKNIYEDLLVRNQPDKWKREKSCLTDAEYSAMYDAAVEWGERYDDQTTEVSIENDGLKLCGRFTDFGSQKTVLIMCGRAEGCLYSYYYAEPYRQSGYNVLVIDSRAHGNSEGKYSGKGYLEQADVLKWMQLLHENYHTTSIVLHGVCIGAACAVYVAANSNCPSYLSGIVVDGLFYSFYKVFQQRFKTNKKPKFPVLYEILYWIKKNTGIDIKKQGPIEYIDKVKVSVLFIHSKEDISSLPEFVPVLFEKCNAPKELIWMDKGAHSHLRIVNQQRYDSAVINYLETL